MSSIFLRPYELTDAEAIAAVCRDAVVGIGSQFYTPQQIAVWSLFPEDLEQFRHRLNSGLTLVGVSDRQITAFGQLQPDDRIAFLYTALKYARQGYATAIYQQLETHASQQGIQYLHADASRISKFFFLKQGFKIVESEIAIRHGVGLERFKMQKNLRDI